MDDQEKIRHLGEYFKKSGDVAMAFLFGSRVKGYARRISDWDIAVYFKTPKDTPLELESEREYPESHEIWGELEKIVGGPVDLVILNRAAPALVFSVLNRGLPLIIKDRTLYLRLLSKTHYEAVDFWQFTRDFLRIRERSRSLSAEDKSGLIRHLIFLENELQDIEFFRKVTQQQYTQDRAVKRNLERWVENIVMASMDIAKIMLSSEKKEVPDSYRETLRSLGLHQFDDKFASSFADFAELRNIIAHEYLELRWKRIQKFIEQAAILFPRFIARMKEIAGE